MRDSWLHIAVHRVGSAIGCCCSKNHKEDNENPVVVNELISHNIQLQPVNPPNTKNSDDFTPLNSIDPIKGDEEYEIDKSEIDGLVSVLCTYELNSIRDCNDAKSNDGCVMTLEECDVRRIPYTSSKEKNEQDTLESNNPYTSIPKNLNLIINNITPECVNEVVNTTRDILQGGEI